MYEETDKSMSTLAVHRIVEYSRVLLHAVPIAGHIRLGYMPGVASLVACIYRMCVYIARLPDIVSAPRE